MAYFLTSGRLYRYCDTVHVLEVFFPGDGNRNTLVQELLQNIQKPEPDSQPLKGFKGLVVNIIEQLLRGPLTDLEGTQN
jgi:hypothetical protein